MGKQFFLSLFATGGMVFALCGCEAMGGRDSRDSQLQKQQFEMVRAQTNQMNQVSASISALQNSNAEIVKIVNDFNQKIANLEQRSAALEKNISSLQQQLTAEKQERQTTINKMIDQVSKEVSKASTPAPSSGGSGPVGAGDFLEHKVESGQTLGAIAKAYGVTVQEIMTANRMKDSVLRVGQTLYVPKKK
ncbi:MAG: LysM peptidoglycan-binding domain-containing protein [Lentisphaerae bacterium]|nr:LysM peptidoglycan-binding domain-containing protein [Lentisphaerota bacterium]